MKSTNRKMKSVLLLILLIIMVFAGSSATWAQTTKTLRWAFFGPPTGSYPDLTKWMGEEITRRTDGRIKNQIFLNTLGRYPDATSMVATGVADVGWVYGLFTQSKNPLWDTLSLPTNSADVWAQAEANLELTKKVVQKAELDAQGVFALNAQNVVGTQIILFRKEITSLDEMKGLRLRAATAVHLDIFKRLGAVPVNIPINEIYDSIDKGVIDGLHTSITAVNIFKLFEAAKYLALLKLNGSSSQCWVINKKLWESFDPETQQVFLEVSNEWKDRLAHEMIVGESNMVKEMQTKHGVKAYDFPVTGQAKLEATAAASRQAWFKKWSEKGVDAEKFFNEYLKLTAKYEKEVAEKGYPWER